MGGAIATAHPAGGTVPFSRTYVSFGLDLNGRKANSWRAHPENADRVIEDSKAHDNPE